MTDTKLILIDLFKKLVYRSFSQEISEIVIRIMRFEADHKPSHWKTA